MESADYLWLPFLDRPQYDIVVFATITFQVCKILVTKWKHVIGPNDKIFFHEEFEILSASIVEMVHIYESSHKEAIVIFITSKDLNMTKNIFLQRMMMETALNCLIQNILYNDPNRFVVS